MLAIRSLPFIIIIIMKEFIVRLLQCGHEHGALHCQYYCGLCDIRVTDKTRICAAEMAVRYAAPSACRKVHVCHCNSLGGAT